MKSVVEICILAGGLSVRMGRDKARITLEGKTLLRRVQEAARKTNRPVRVIRRDLVERCGPLGGVYTALKTTTADGVLFLACDMPFAGAEQIANIIDLWPGRSGAVFTQSGPNGKAGFPFILRRNLFHKVESQLAECQYSLQSLAACCHARLFKARDDDPNLFNVNTPSDWAAARRHARQAKVGPIDASKRAEYENELE